jgi:phage shock protein A
MEGVLKTMYIAKIKTTALVLCSVAVLGVGTGGVYYQTRVGAADTPQDIQSEQRPIRKAVRGQDRSPDDWRRIAEDLRRQLEAERDKAKATEQELRSLAAKLHQETMSLRERIEMMTQQAAVREKQARETLAHQQRLQHSASSNSALEKLAVTRELFAREYKEGIANLDAQLKELDAQQEALQGSRKKIQHDMEKWHEQFRQRSKQLEDMRDRIRKEQAEQSADQPKPKTEPARSDDDKFDQILKRLERLENRLDRVDKSRQ